MNGWSNHSTWQVVAQIDNDEILHKEALKFTRIFTTLHNTQNLDLAKVLEANFCQLEGAAGANWKEVSEHYIDLLKGSAHGT